VGEVAGPAGPAPPATIYGGPLGELDQIDQALYRVHYPDDVLVGSLMGTSAAVAVRSTSRALTRRRASPSQPGGATMSGSAASV
jgi:hypothetical protein